MSSVDKALQTQIENIHEKSGKSLEELFDFISQSGLEKHGQIRNYLKSKFGLGHGDANTVTHLYRTKDEEKVPLNERVDEIYSGKREVLRPIHDEFMKAVERFGQFEVAPKKGYLSLRRKKQFAMVGPATNSQVEIGINAQDLSGGDRLIENKPGSMSQYRVRVSDPADVDAELIGWVRQAFDAAG